MDDSSVLSPKAAAIGGAWSTAQMPPLPLTDKESYGKRDNASVNAVSFGFVATAVLISMFLAMAFFERFLRPRSSFSPVSPLRVGQSVVRDAAAAEGSLKRDNAIVEYVTGISVLMPGQDIPTFIAKPLPILCPRESISWPAHAGSCDFGTGFTNATSENSVEVSIPTYTDLSGSSSVTAPGGSSAA